MKPGISFHFPLKSNIHEPHLWVVAAQKNSQILIVNLTSRRASSDNTVILDPGDHPFIKHETVVNYAGSRIVDTAQIQKAIEEGNANPDIRFTQEVLERIQEGIELSEFTPLRIIEFYKKSEEI